MEPENQGKLTFNFKNLLKEAKNKFINREGSVSINLPFISFNFEPEGKEKKVARELIIRMKNRRVLSSQECCDNCIDNSLESIQEIRKFLVEKQVELSHMTDSPIYLLMELQVEAIRQFLTFSERLESDEMTEGIMMPGDSHRVPPVRKKYFSALEVLRGHLHRCINELSKIAETNIPEPKQSMEYSSAWKLESYETPGLQKKLD